MTSVRHYAWSRDTHLDDPIRSLVVGWITKKVYLIPLICAVVFLSVVAGVLMGVVICKISLGLTGSSGFGTLLSVSCIEILEFLAIALAAMPLMCSFAHGLRSIERLIKIHDCPLKLYFIMAFKGFLGAHTDSPSTSRSASSIKQAYFWLNESQKNSAYGRDEKISGIAARGDRGFLMSAWIS